MSSIHGRCLCGAVSGSNLQQTAGHELVSCYQEDGFSPRYFCAQCGTSLWSGGPDPYYVNAGVLEDPGLEVACHIQVADKADWHNIGGEAPQYPQFPG